MGLKNSGAWPAVAAVAAVLLCAGCAPANTTPHATSTVPPTASASPMRAGPVLSGTVSISGAASIPTTRFTVGAQMEVGQNQTSPPAQSTCADYANGFAVTSGGGTGFTAPMLQTDGYHNIYVGVSIATGYHGPGAYDSKGSPSLDGSAVEAIGSGESAVYTVFHSGDQGSTTLVVHADGSGSLTITHWDSDEVRQSAGASQVNINGLVTWTCSG